MAKVSRCPYCGHEMRGHRRAPTTDHVVPRALGGRLDDGNKLIVCRACNGEKGDRTLEAWRGLLAIARDPREPFVARVIRARATVAATWPHGGGNLTDTLATMP